MERQLANNLFEMTPKQISNKRYSIETRRLKLVEELKTLQLTCEHTDLESIHKGSTGNYDPHNDEYWIEHNCHSCGKFWTTPTR